MMLYARMLFGVLISLYTSRLILASLGETDYGIYNVVGGLVSMFAIVRSSLSTAVGRFQAYAIGRGDKKGMQDAFTGALITLTAIALLVVILMETAGLWFMNTHMTIGASRLLAAKWVFHCSVISFVSSTLMIPFSASVIAHEKMDAFAFIGIFEILFRFFIALFLAYSAYRGDKLIIYAILSLLFTIIVQIIYIVYCRAHFDECRTIVKPEKKVFKGIVGFASWSFLGSAAGVINGQGVNVAFNMFHGPALNAARGVSESVNNVVVNFVRNFMMALNPQVTKAYAAEEKDYTIALVKRGTRFSFYIMLFIGVPVFLEVDFLVNLWLVDVPEHAISFIRLVMLRTFMDILSSGAQMGQEATGNIRNYQIVTSLISLLVFVFSFLLLKLGFAPEATYVVAIIISFLLMLVNASFIQRSIGLPFMDYMKDVILNIIFVTIPAVIIPVLISLTVGEGWLRLVLVCLTSVIFSSISILYIGCNKGERLFIFNSAKSYLARFRKGNIDVSE